MLLRKTNSRLAFCCLGVARFKLDDGELWTEPLFADYDKDTGYIEVRAEYNMSKRMQDYLVAMNDGKYVTEVSLTGGFVSWDGRDMLEDQRIIRNTNESRSFEYIARFLEIAWRLTDTNTAGNVRLPNIK